MLGQASGPDGSLATLEVDYEDVAPKRLLTVRCINQTAVGVSVTVTQVGTGRSATRTFGPGTTELALPTAVATRLVLNGLRRGQLDGIAIDVAVPA